MTQPKVNLVLTDLSTDGKTLFLHLESTDEKKLLIKEPTTRKMVHSIFPKLIVASTGKVFLANSQNQPFIEVDTTSDLAKVLLNELDIRMIESGRERSANINNVVPAELRGKYCLIFGDKVWESADTRGEIEQKALKHTGIFFTTYIPKL